WRRYGDCKRIGGVGAGPGAFFLAPLAPVLGGEGLGVRGLSQHPGLDLRNTPPHPQPPSPRVQGERGARRPLAPEHRGRRRGRSARLIVHAPAFITPAPSAAAPTSPGAPGPPCRTPSGRPARWPAAEHLRNCSPA